MTVGEMIGMGRDLTIACVTDSYVVYESFRSCTSGERRSDKNEDEQVDDNNIRWWRWIRCLRMVVDLELIGDSSFPTQIPIST